MLKKPKQQNKATKKHNENRQTTKPTSVLHLSHLAITSSVFLVALGIAVSQAVDPLVQTPLLANVPYAMSFFSGSRPFSDFWYIINTEPLSSSL